MRPLRVSSRAQPVFWLLAGLVTSVLLTVGAVWIFDPRYLYNDDMIIASILSGDYTGVPDARSIYGGPGMSVLVSSIGRLWDGIPWFLLLCTWCNIIMLLLVGFYLFRRIALGGSSFWLLAVPLIAAQCTVAVWALLLPSYSAAAIAAGTASLSLLFIYLQSRSRQGLFPMLLVGSVLLFAAGWGLREGGFPLVGLLVAAAPSVVVLLGHLRCMQASTLIAAWLVVAVVDRFLKSYLYSNPVWIESLQVVDRLNLIWSGYVFGSIVPIGMAQGWSGAEIGLAQYLTPVPSEGFTLGSLNSFVEAAQLNVLGTWAISRPGPDFLPNAFFANSHAFLLIGILCLAVAAYLVFVRGTAIKVWFLLFGGVTNLVAVILFLALIRNNTAHVSLPLSLGAMTLLVMAISLIMQPFKAAPLSSAAFAISLGLTALFVALAWRLPFGAGSSIEGLNVKKQVWGDQRAVFQRLNPRCVILGANLGAENAPARDTSELFGEFPLMQITWNSLTPHTDSRLTFLGKESWASLFDVTSCTYFVGGPEHAEMVAEVTRKEYGVMGGFKSVIVQGEQISGVWQWQGG